jgi:hypothetical protein
MTKPIIGRFSNEQIHFTRRTNYRRSDFEQDIPRATLADVKFALAVIAAIVIVTVGVRAA